MRGPGDQGTLNALPPDGRRAGRPLQWTQPRGNAPPRQDALQVIRESPCGLVAVVQVFCRRLVNDCHHDKKIVQGRICRSEFALGNTRFGSWRSDAPLPFAYLASEDSQPHLIHAGIVVAARSRTEGPFAHGVCARLTSRHSRILRCHIILRHCLRRALVHGPSVTSVSSSRTTGNSRRASRSGKTTRKRREGISLLVSAFQAANITQSRLGGSRWGFLGENRCNRPFGWVTSPSGVAASAPAGFIWERSVKTCRAQGGSGRMWRRCQDIHRT